MSDYAPGTVAIIGLKTATPGISHRMMAYLHDDGCWYSPQLIQFGEHCVTDEQVSGITPLVCIEATREDAVFLTRLLNAALMKEDFVYSDTRGPELLRSLIAAIREQTPAPLEIPENLGAVVEDDHGHVYHLVAPDDKHPWFSPQRATGVTMRDLALAWFSTADIREWGVRVLSEGVTP